MSENEIKDSDASKTGSTGKKGGSGTEGTGGSAGGIRLSVNQFKDITNEREHLTGSNLATRLAEFFSELPAKASAQVQVSWANLKNHGYAIVTQLLKYGQEVARLVQNFTPQNAEILRMKYGLIISGPSG